ncbi:50S ribosome-binding GTPase [Helicobacter pylori]|uniref:GTPase n=1 Tax=Helicobacter pylori TaxID=210 RepID=UPI001AE79210|nr:GTPase [Helicobacter pylori]QTO99036.1 50S ribosome-binding GTPase [Helicobacter pylori]
MEHDNSLGGAFNKETGELNTDKLREHFKNLKGIKESKMNILLMGYTGSGKSSLINALFGKEIAKAGVGKPITQHLEKYIDEQKGLILWDTKGIEAADYHDTMQSIKKEMEDSFKTLNEKEAIDVAYLCVKETSGRVQERERELLSFAKHWNIPTIVVFTHTQAEAGEAFVQESKGIIDEEWGFKGFVRDYVRVNSVAFSFRGLKVPVEGLEELVDETKKCLSDAIKNKKNHFLSVQKANIQKRKQAMIEECKTIIHVASGAAGVAEASPIPFSDMPLIAGVQKRMIHEMNDAFEVSLGKSATPTFITEISSIIALAHVGRTLVNGFLKFIPVVESVAGGATAAVITEGIGFAYLKVLEKCFNDETGEVNLPGEVGMITSLFKENYLNLDTIKQLTLKP